MQVLFQHSNTLRAGDCRRCINLLETALWLAQASARITRHYNCLARIGV